MANPLWIPGSKSANPAGRPKHSVRTPKGMILRFINRNISPQKLQKLFEKVSEKDRLAFITELLPYVMPKQSADGINQDEVQTLKAMLEEALKQNNHGKAV